MNLFYSIFSSWLKTFNFQLYAFFSLIPVHMKTYITSKSIIFFVKNRGFLMEAILILDA